MKPLRTLAFVLAVTLGFSAFAELRTSDIAALEASQAPLTDQVIIDNAKAGTKTSFGLWTDSGAEVVAGPARVNSESEVPSLGKTVFTGVYDDPVVISADDSYVFSNATLRAGLVVADGVTAKLNAATNTVNAISSVSAPCAEVRLTGDGTVKIEGADTLMTVSNLVVKSGTFRVKSTGVAVTKTPVVNVLGFIEQSGGTIDMDLDVATTNQIYGIYVANKDLKDASGNNIGVVYALFDGGEFNATVGAAKSAAVYVNKGSVNTTFKGGETVTAVLKGVEPRFLNSAGDVELKRVTVNVTMPGSYGSINGARVFKSDKKITVSDAEARFDVNVPGPDAEVFASGDKITIEGGVFEIVASDDCFSALNRIKISGGLIYAVSKANDVFDSNGDMEISGGTILAYATAQGHEAFDVDPGQTDESGYAHQLRIDGGTVFAVGGKSSVWPADIVIPDGFGMYLASDIDSSACSGKYASLRSTVDMVVTAKLPVFPASKCSLLMTCPNMTGSPTYSPTAPSVGSQDFHDLYIEMQGEANQSSLRFLEIYGSTSAEGGDVGEYIVLTNISGDVVQLAGVTVSIAKHDIKNGKIDDPKCVVTLSGGTVPAYGSICLYKTWTKITNGNIFVKITDALGGVVQSGYASFDNAKYPGVDGGGEALVAIRFDTTLEDSTDYWRSTAPEPHTHGSGTVDWDHPVATIDAATSADVAWPTLAGSDLAKANASKLQAWAKNVGKVPFESAGGIKLEAFLLNCDNTDAAIDAAKAEFKFASFDPDDLPTPEDLAGKGYNGIVRIEGCNDLASDNWGSVEDGDHFFRAVLTLE